MIESQPLQMAEVVEIGRLPRVYHEYQSGGIMWDYCQKHYQRVLRPGG